MFGAAFQSNHTKQVYIALYSYVANENESEAVTLELPANAFQITLIALHEERTKQSAAKFRIKVTKLVRLVMMFVRDLFFRVCSVCRCRNGPMLADVANRGGCPSE